jgi:hypothetical protein
VIAEDGDPGTVVLGQDRWRKDGGGARSFKLGWSRGSGLVLPEGPPRCENEEKEKQGAELH